MNPNYDIGPFRLEPEAGVLFNAGVCSPLGPRGVAVLTVLVRRANQYVGKAAIMDAVWPGVVVEENSLAAQIAAIRRVLAQTPGGERWVETLARRGYRFVGPVTEAREDVGKASAARALSNLVQPRTSFIGRERALAEIKKLLPGTRLLTLVGIGGIGKTRLAVQVAREVVEHYRDGVWLVELGAISDPALVVTAVARALGIHEQPQKSVQDTLCGYVKARQLLLVLDNCEHLLDACAKLAATLLHAGSELTIIATSREPLRVAHEQVYPLPTLSLPDPAASPEIAACSESVQLFLDRARAAGPCFGLDAACATSVAAICRRLDGIPLAIEMAAARAPALGVEKLADKLDESFRLLALGWRTALPRQETLRATLDWSYGLLAEPERTVLRRLAVFRGGFTLEAASSVASDEQIDGFEVMDLVSQLVARSLVAVDPSERYRLLEVIRAYANEKLAEAGETGAIQRRHAECFRDVFESAPDDWIRMPDAKWRATYFPELDNVRAALDWAFGAEGDAALGIALAGGAGEVWFDLTAHSEGRRRLEAAAAQIGPDTPEVARAQLWLYVARIIMHTAPAAALDAAERAEGSYRRAGDALGCGLALMERAVALAFMGRFDQAASALADARPLLEGSELPKVVAMYHSASGFVATLKGQPDTARTHYQQALALYRRAKADSQALRTLINLAHVTWALGENDPALELCHEAIGLLRQSQPTYNLLLAFALAYVVGIQTERGEIEAALTAARECLPLLGEEGCAWNILDDFALLAALAGNIRAAARATGYTDTSYTAGTASRPPHVAQSRAKVEVLLREKLVPEELERLRVEGAKMTDEEACRVVQ